jgi:hypothetical protein
MQSRNLTHNSRNIISATRLRGLLIIFGHLTSSIYQNSDPAHTHKNMPLGVPVGLAHIRLPAFASQSKTPHSLSKASLPFITPDTCHSLRLVKAAPKICDSSSLTGLPRCLLLPGCSAYSLQPQNVLQLQLSFLH